MNFRRLLAVMGWAALCVLVSCGDPPFFGSGSKPNVLLVVIDTARADFFSCYGHEPRTTPFIDRLASEGTLYTGVFATAFWTLPSHASLLTGAYPTEVQATSETTRLPGRAGTLAERLAEEGYETGAVVCNPWISIERGFGQGFTDYREMWRGGEGGAPSLEQIERAAAYAAVEWLEERPGGDKPFFLFVNFNTPHLPYIPPEPFRKRFVGSETPPRILQKVMRIREKWSHHAGALQLGERDFQTMRGLYEGEIALADTYVGRLVKTLNRLGMLDETLVIVTSDHGENIGDHGMISHELSMHDTVLRVPLIVRYPKRFRPNHVVDDLVSLVDIAPTVLDVCGLSGGLERLGTDGRSLCDPDREIREYVLAENDRPLAAIALLREYFPQADATAIDYRIRCARTKRHKLVWRIDGGMEMYDLIADPGESRDLARTEPPQLPEMVERIRSWMERVDTGERPDPFESRDRESLERLRALGYVH